jgi:hypothetical protein
MTTYYVNPNATGSSDLNPGTNITRPLKTLNKANTLSASGDKVIVYPSTYREQVLAKTSNVQWSAADLGVVIDGTDQLTGSWTDLGGGLYSLSYAPPGGTAPALLHVDGVPFITTVTSQASISYQLETLSQIVWNAFYFNAATNTLYLNLNGANPNSHSIRAGVRTSAFTFDSLTSCVVDGFMIKGSNVYGVRVQGGGSHQILNGQYWGNNNGGIRLEAPTPQLFAPADAGAGGTLAAGTYAYVVTAIIGGNETLASFERTLTIAANRKIQVQWSGVTNATSYKVYGRTTVGKSFITSVAVPGSGFPTWVDDGSLTPDGVTFPPTSTSTGTNNNLIENVDVWQSGSHGISLYAAQQSSVRRSRSHHNAFHGVALLNYANDNIVEEMRCYRNSQLPANRVANGIQSDNFGLGTPGALRNTIQRNRCFDNQDSGISIYNGSHDNIVRLNILYGNGDHGVDNLDSQRCHMINNVAYNNVTAGLNAEGHSEGIRMFNNISMDNGLHSPRTTGNYRVDQTANSDAQMDYNVSYLTVPAASQSGGNNGEFTWGTLIYGTLAAFRAAVPTQMVHGISANPLFNNLAQRNFRLQESSPAHNAGTNTAPDYIAFDREGTAQPTPPNCGAYV